MRTAIRSPHNAGATLKRVNAVLGLYFDPDNDPETRAAVRREFVVALAAYPDWAVQRAFDAWVRTGARRPTPGEIVILVGRELKPMTDELARRERDESQSEEDRQHAIANRVTPDAAARILADAGMTEERLLAVRRFPMARNMAEIEEKATPSTPLRDWTEGLAEDDPRLVALRRSRASSLVCQPKDRA